MSTQVDQLTRERDAWIESARQHARNEDFYRSVVRQIGEMFGVAARTSDDGSIQQDVLALKVPELVTALRDATAELMTVAYGARESLGSIANIQHAIDLGHAAMPPLDAPRSGVETTPAGA